jgi:hypothetical protein
LSRRDREKADMPFDLYGDATLTTAEVVFPEDLCERLRALGFQ